MESTANTRSTRARGAAAESAERFQRSTVTTATASTPATSRTVRSEPGAHHPLAEEDRDQPEHRGRGEEGAPCVHRHRRASSTRVVAKSATQVTSR